MKGHKGHGPFSTTRFETDWAVGVLLRLVVVAAAVVVVV
jgi:hypothetical protein